MLTHPPEGSPIPDLAAQLGLQAGVTKPAFGYPFPALYGSFAGLWATMKTYGGRWNGRDRCMEFGNWAAMEAALRAVIELRGLSKPAPGPTRSG